MNKSILIKGENIMFEMENNMFGVEIHKEFKNKYELYKYAIVDSLNTNLESAREELEDNEFIALCLQICGFMAEYFT